MIDLPPVDLKTALDIAGRIASIAKTLKDFAGVVPPGGRRRRRRHAERERAYLAFQRATLEMSVWAGRLQLLQTAAPHRRYNLAYALAELAAELAEKQTKRESPPAGSSAGGWFRSMGQLALATEATERTYVGILLQEFSQFSAATTTFLAALTEVRLVGNPGPREAAENIVALTGELISKSVTPDPNLWERATRRALRRADARQRASEAADDCRLALGYAHRDFTLAARRDLGYDGTPRWWQWRQRRRADAWPGGWPGPDPQQLIDQAREHQRQLEEASGRSGASA